MKALELTVYPLLEKVGRLAERGYIVNRKPITYWYVEHYQIFEKRLTDTELAAEYHSQDARCRHEQWIETVRGDDDYEDWERAGQSRMYDQLSMLHRFATLPHYDEDQP